MCLPGPGISQARAGIEGDALGAALSSFLALFAGKPVWRQT